MIFEHAPFNILQLPRNQRIRRLLHQNTCARSDHSVGEGFTSTLTKLKQIKVAIAMVYVYICYITLWQLQAIYWCIYRYAHICMRAHMRMHAYAYAWMASAGAARAL